ncbi:hypothetical protein FNF27_03954 [Cafeteria roenbergensis]|uniref:Uncharacterized protein n=1 Tax=Cafeteria roenbergensis TaxID=33653 RepID=A0A5A8D0I7_CAFRO|nr:hypothetical protein FNF28_06169 [Cafeteria roenbergensis]KAA0174579.1 hypothetical protein FNF27_03954 [Cafeteria roenbergensis]
MSDHQKHRRINKQSLAAARNRMRSRAEPGTRRLHGASPELRAQVEVLRGFWASVHETMLHQADSDGHLIVAGACVLLATRRLVGSEEHRLREVVFSTSLASLGSLHATIRAEGGTGDESARVAAPSLLGQAARFRELVLARLRVARSELERVWEGDRKAAVGAGEARSQPSPFSATVMRMCHLWLHPPDKAQRRAGIEAASQGRPAAEALLEALPAADEEPDDLLEQVLDGMLRRIRAAKAGRRQVEAAEWGSLLAM